jgi:drug/metabolite transporter (DMT)-like permease
MDSLCFQLRETGADMPRQFDSKSLGYLYVAAAAIIWGSNGVIVNRVPYSAHTIAFFRVLFASLTLLPVVLLTRKRELVSAARSWRTILVLGFLLASGWALLFNSMKLIAIANAVLINYTAPIFVALLAPLLLNEKLERSTLVALAISVAGIVLISHQQNLQTSAPDDLSLLGVMFGLLASLAYAGFILVSKKALSSFSSHVVAFYSYSVASIFLLPFVIGAVLSVDLTPWLLLLVLGVFNTAFAVTLYLRGLGMLKAQKAVVFTYLEPASAAVFGFFLLAQQPTPLMVVGGLLILIAGYVAASR